MFSEYLKVLLLVESICELLPFTLKSSKTLFVVTDVEATPKLNFPILKFCS